MNKRSDQSIWLALSPLYSVGLGLIASGLMMLLLKHNPIEAFAQLFGYAFRDMYNVADIFAKATPLILTGLAFGFAFRATLFQHSAQGSSTWRHRRCFSR